jgi:hypothetical protein
MWLRPRIFDCDSAQLLPVTLALPSNPPVTPLADSRSIADASRGERRAQLPRRSNPEQDEERRSVLPGGPLHIRNPEESFYEGAIVAGYPSDETDNAVQVNIVAAGYSK